MNTRSFCKSCGRLVFAERLIKDPSTNRKICPQCLLIQKEKQAHKALLEKKPVPVSIVRTRKSETPKKRITCSKCKFTFGFDPERKLPSVCPYCKRSVL